MRKRDNEGVKKTKHSNQKQMKNINKRNDDIGRTPNPDIQTAQTSKLATNQQLQTPNSEKHDPLPKENALLNPQVLSSNT